MSVNHASTPLATGQPVTWGIIGTGYIAHLFAADLAHVPDARLVAIGSRSEEKARAFANQFAIPRHYGSYAELADDPSVQAIYIATPASVHKDNMLLCLNAGKAVLCEKPLTVNAREAEEVIDRARDGHIFLMEAMWTRFVPTMVKLRELLAAGVIGEIRHFIGDLGSRVPFNPQGRVFNAALKGGALSEKGIYLLSLASMILGRPNRVMALASIGKTGVDEWTAVTLSYPGARVASLFCSVLVRTRRDAVIVGNRGRLRIHEPVICPGSLTVRIDPNRGIDQAPPLATSQAGVGPMLVNYGKSSRWIRAIAARYPALSDRLLYGIRSKTIHSPPIGHGLHYQVSEVHRCLRAGQQESDVMSWNESLNIIATMDQIKERAETL
jgi:dihydrodiol dehydrogenase / D-xylose 1-dehydrogenase (NADP)